MNFEDLTHADLEKTQGVVTTYNDLAVEQLPMYYDRVETDRVFQIMFDNAFKGLNDMNDKLKKELEAEDGDKRIFKKVDLSIDRVE
jgi:hypothetical protein